VEIQRTRFGDGLVLAVDVPAQLRTALVPSLILQPLVENSIRHGFGAQPGHGRIQVRARGGGGTLTLEVVDDGTGFEPGRVRDPDSYGLRGLKTLVADCGGELGVRSSPGEGTTVRMEVDAA
jgi:sensor histidine kinase YesM